MKKGENDKYFVFRVYINRETHKTLCDRLRAMPNHARNALIREVLGDQRASTAQDAPQPDLKGVFG